MFFAERHTIVATHEENMVVQMHNSLLSIQAFVCDSVCCTETEYLIHPKSIRLKSLNSRNQSKISFNNHIMQTRLLYEF